MATAPIGRFAVSDFYVSGIIVVLINCYILNPSVLLGQEHDGEGGRGEGVEGEIDMMREPCCCLTTRSTAR